MSTDGKVIVGEASDGDSDTIVALKWSGAGLSPTILGLGHPSSANGDGSVIVGGSIGDPPSAMLWDNSGAHVLKDLLGATSDLNGWSLIRWAVGVSDDGKFVAGYGQHGTQTEGFIAHLP